MGGGILIDPRGRVWPDDSWDVARRIGYKDARNDVATFAVRERGFVHLRPRPDAMHVALREGRFNLTAFAGLMLELGRVRPPRIMLRVLGDDDPKFQLFSDLHDLSTQLEALVQDKPLQTRIPRLSERRNLAVLRLPTFAPARPLVELWEKTRGELTDDIEGVVDASGLKHRIMLARRMPRTSRLVFWHIGSGFMVLRPCESFLAIGRDLHDQPDKEYGEWVAEAYAQVAWDYRLRVDSCRASIHTSTPGLLRARYDRVLLPWRAKDELFVMGLSIQREVSVLDS